LTGWETVAVQSDETHDKKRRPIHTVKNTRVPKPIITWKNIIGGYNSECGGPITTFVCKNGLVENCFERWVECLLLTVRFLTTC